VKENILLKDIFETIGAGVFIADLKGALIEVNKNLADALGYKTNELTGKHLLDIAPHHISEFSPEYPTPMINKILTEGAVKNNEIKYVKKDGSFLFAEMNINILKDADGNITNYIGIVHDISERKVWEQKIKEKEDFLRKIIHADPNLIFVKHRNGKYVEVSEAVAKLFRTSPDRVVGKTDLELAKTRKLSIHEAARLKADDMDVLDSGKQKFIEEESITQADGKIKWFQTTKVPLVLNNKADYLLGVAVDITLRKKTIDLLKEKEKELEVKNKNLEELNAALKIVLQQKDKDRIELEKKVLNNMKNLIEPYLNKLKNLSHDNSQKNFIEIIETNLKEVVSSFSNKLSSEYISLTASELQVADFIKKDFSSKEIAEQLNMAMETVASHRKHIRKKLSITNKKTNLSSFLKSLQ
jgi:PAS domain S-box-containing protein